jgi:V/A-type H+/Na+-transporting ATPase subunit C
MRVPSRSDFAYGNTRLHARWAGLLGTADYEHLLGQDVDGLLAVLDRTAYAPEAERARDQTGLRRLHETIRAHLGRSLEQMRGFYASRARELVDLMLSRFDLQNVVLMLRGRAGTRRPAEEALGALVPVGWVDEPLAREILGRPELAGAVDLVARRTPDSGQASALRAAYSAYERTEDLAALEHAVLADHAERVTATLASALPDARTLLRFAQRALDERNLLIALRLRDARASGAATDVAPEGALFPGGSVPLAGFAAAVRAPAPAAVISALPRIAGSGWQAPLGRWAASGDLATLERDLQRRRIADATALFRQGDPLTLDMPIAFTAAKETEARNLRLLAEASARGIHAEVVRRELLWPRVDS